MTRVQKLVIASMLVAVQIVLTRTLGIDLGPSQRISFSFVAVVINGALLGPLTAGLSGAVADVIGFIIKPTGPYFPGFTISAVLVGLVYGLFYYKKEINLTRIILASAIVTLGINLCLNTYWIHLLIGAPYLSLLIGRLPFALVMLGVKILVQALVLTRAIKEMRRYLKIRAA